MTPMSHPSGIKRIFQNPLVWMFFIMAFWIFFSSLIHFTGRVDTDGRFYLNLSRHLLRGTVYTNGYYETQWPAGWPLSIAIFTKLFFADAWLASKLALLFYFTLSSLLIVKTLKENHLPAVFFFASYLFIFNESNSEAQFIFFELLGFYLTLKYLETERNRYLYLLPLATAGAYATRYYGLFTGIFFAYIFFRNLMMRRPVGRVVIVAIISLLFPIGYMLVNRALTGTLVGPRPEGVLTTTQFLQNVAEAYSLVADPFIDKIGHKPFFYLHALVVPIFGATLYVFRKIIFHKPFEAMPEADRLLLFTALMYVLPITLLRWFKYFTFDIRILSPGTLFLWLFILRRMNRKILYAIGVLALSMGIAKAVLHSVMVEREPFYYLYMQSKKDGVDIVDAISGIKDFKFDGLERKSFRQRMRKFDGTDEPKTEE